MSEIPARLADNLRTFGLEGDKLDALRQSYDITSRGIDPALDDFYKFALANPDMARFFGPSGDVSHARARQKEHWQILLSGRFDRTYIDSAHAVGNVHFKIQLPFDFYFGAYSRVSSLLVQHLADSVNEAGLSGAETARMIAAVNSAFALDSSVIVDAYSKAQEAELNAAFQQLSRGMDHMANGDLTQLIGEPAESGFPERYDSVRQDYNKAVSLLGQICATISGVTGDMSTSTQNVQSATDDLSRRTESQAATLEETAAAVEQLTRSIQQSTEHTAKVDSEMKAASDRATGAREVVREAIDTMEAIETSSKQIAAKIGAINEIAFQTNLLALNAGVEAARAGDHGRGFAVVASEVRALAGRAADTAREIHEIIDESSKQVSQGTEKVGRTGEALEAIAHNVVEVSTLVSEITTTAQEQATGLSDINSSVGQLDAVTQKNAAMAEETTAAAQDMIALFAQLSEVVGKLRIPSDNGQTARQDRAA